MDGHHPTGGGLLVGLGPAGQFNPLAGVLEQALLADLQLNQMVQVDGVEQSLDDGEAIHIDGSQSCVDGRPGRTHQRIGGEAGGDQRIGQGASGGRLMVEAQVGCQGVAAVGQAEGVLGVIVLLDGRHGLQLVAGDGGVADAGCVGQQGVDVLGQAGAVDHREEADLVALDGQRHDDVAHRMPVQAAVGVVVPVGVQVDVQVVVLAQVVLAGGGDGVVGVVHGRPVGRIGHQVAHPGDVGAAADELLRVSGACQLAVGLGGTAAQVAHPVYGRLLEPSQNGGHRLVHRGDARHGDGSGDGPDRVGAVAGIFGLPELILAPPAQQVVVDDRHEGHGLGILAHQDGEPGHVGGHHLELGCLWVGLMQSAKRLLGLGHILPGGEDGVELAALTLADTGLDAPQQVQEAVDVGVVGPGVGQVGETLGPVLVGHGLQIAEVGLGGLVQGLDDLPAAGLQLLRVLHDPDQQAAALGGGVLHLVDVGVQVAQAGAHAPHRLAAGHPLLPHGSEGVRIGG